MGEMIKILDREGGWLKIVALEQKSRKDGMGYPGWVYSQNVTLYSYSNPVIIVGDIVKAYKYREGEEVQCTLLLDSRVDFLGYADGMARIGLANRTVCYVKEEYISIKHLEQSAESVIEHMYHFLDLGYLWGGTSPYGFDCSGLLYRVGHVHGYKLARDARDQALQGEEVKELERGDAL